MMKRVNRLVSTLLTAFILTTTIAVPVHADEASVSTVTETITSDLAIFENGKTDPIESVDELYKDAITAKLIYTAGTIDSDITLKDVGDLHFSARLFPSQMELGEGKALLGKCLNISEGYRLASFRIETDATELTLMKPNLYMKGKTILNLGIQDIKVNKVYYLQTTIETLNFYQMKVDAEANFAKGRISSECLMALENDYFFMLNYKEEHRSRLAEIDYIFRYIHHLKIKRLGLGCDNMCPDEWGF